MNSPESFEEIVQTLAQPLLKYLNRYVGDRALAEDLRQETLLRMARGLSSFEGHSSVKTWAFAIASRVAADHLRRPGRAVRMVEMDESVEPPDPAHAAEERLINDEMNACVRQVIDTLPESYRSALILRELEELSLEEVAEVCGCTLATAKIRLHRARARLKEALKEQCAFYRDGDGVYRCQRRGAAEVASLP